MTLLLGGCISIASPFGHSKPNFAKFPVEDMKSIALEIEQAVQKGERQPEIADRGGLKISTDAIRQAIRTRAARSELLNEFLSSGNATEDFDGLVALTPTKEYKKKASGKERDRDALLIMSENSSRWAIYEGIRDASDLPAKSLSAIQNIFHEARVQCLTQGQKYADENKEVHVK
jgi:hypothetical protein